MSDALLTDEEARAIAWDRMAIRSLTKLEIAFIRAGYEACRRAGYEACHRTGYRLVVDALKELAMLKELKAQIASGEFPLEFEVAMQADYDERKPLAWNTARAALTGEKKP